MPRFLLVALLGLLLSASAAHAQLADRPVPPSVAAELLKKPNTVVLDVRTPEEFAAGHLKGAMNIDFRAAGFNQKVDQLDKSKNYLVYCASGNRSTQATIQMEETGFKHVVNIGGFEALKAGGLKTKK